MKSDITPSMMPIVFRSSRNIKQMSMKIGASIE